MIQKDATPEDIDKAVAKLEKYLEKNPKNRLQVGDIARRIIKAGKLKNYGTKHAQEYLTKWSKEFVAKKKRPEKKKSEK